MLVTIPCFSGKELRAGREALLSLPDFLLNPDTFVCYTKKVNHNFNKQTYPKKYNGFIKFTY